MSAPEPIAHRKAPLDVDEQRAFRLVHEAVYNRVWVALARHGIPVRAPFDDRHDVAQNIILAAYRRWRTYRDDLGTPGTWLGGIILNEVRAHRRRLTRQPLLMVDDHHADRADPAPSQEERVYFHELRGRAHELYDKLDPDVRRIFVAHEFDGLTFKEIADIEDISTTRAFQIHAQALRELRAAVARAARDQRLHGVLPLPIALATFLHADREVPDVLREQQEVARRRAEDALGFSRSPEVPSAPAARGPAVRAPARQGLLARLAHPHVAQPVMVGLVVAHLVGVIAIVALALLLDDLIRRPVAFFHDDPVPVVAGAPGSGPSAPVPLLEPSTAPSTAAPTDPRKVPQHTEEQAFNTASSALSRGNVALGLAELAQHARLFPNGRHAQEREMLWISALLSIGRTVEACAHAAIVRRAYPKSNEARALARMKCPESPAAP